MTREIEDRELDDRDDRICELEGENTALRSNRYGNLEPIVFTADANGTHFAAESQPLRTIIDPTAAIDAPWLGIDDETGVVTITLDGKTVTYDRIGHDIHGNWICDLRIGSKRGIEG